MIVACGMVWCRITSRMARRMVMIIVCRIVCGRSRRRGWSSCAVQPIAGSRAVEPRRRITSRRVPARVGDLHVSTMFTVGRAARPSSAMPRPNSAGSRRRPRRCTNIYSFVWPWRSLTVQSAARLRRTVGPLSPLKAVAGQTRQRDTIRHHRASPGITGHHRAKNDHRVPYGSVAGHRVGDGHRVPYRLSPDTASRMVVACRIACRRIACGGVRRGGWSSRAVSPVAGSCAIGPVAPSRLVMSRPVSATSCLCRVHGRAI
jgi:hypothetical protein